MKKKDESVHEIIEELRSRVESFKEKMRARNTILIIDDSEDIANILTIVMEAERDGIKIWSATSVQEGLFMVPYVDLIVLDVMMPGMNGIEYLKLLRATGVKTPVIVMSASDEFKKAALENGATAFLLKIDILAMAGAILNCLDA